MARRIVLLLEVDLVKRVIRGRTTKLYLRIDGTWTQNVEEAANFPSSLAVLNAKEGFSLQDIEMVLQIGASPNALFDVVLPLADSVAADYPIVVSSDQKNESKPKAA